MSEKDTPSECFDRGYLGGTLQGHSDGYEQGYKDAHDAATHLITRLTEALNGLVAIFPERPIDDGSGGIGWKETVTKAYDNAQAALAAVAKERAL